VRARRRFGQHFLEPAWVARLVQAFAPSPDDRVLEIGPGRGALTGALAGRVARLVAVEIDRDLGKALAAAAPPNVTVVIRDFLDADLEALIGATLPPPIRAIGNLPYNVAVPILFRLLAVADDGRTIKDAMLMVQREVALRLISPPGSKNYGVLSVMVRRLADVSVAFDLPPGAFRPAPKVESTVVRLGFRPPSVHPVDLPLFESLVRGVFAYRRKTVANALRHWEPRLASQITNRLEAAGIDGRRRPETLHLTELARLADVFASASGTPVL